METTQNNRTEGERKQRPQGERRPRPAKASADAKQQPRKKRTEGDKPRRPAAKTPVKKTQKGQRPPKRPDADDIGAKKRAYGNSKPKKTATSGIAELVKSTLQKSEEKKKKKNPNRSKQPTPAVIYTQPKTFNRNRLVIQLLTVTAVVVALVLGLSVFFKVETITVTGAQVYDPYTIEENSGIKKGDNLLTFSRPRAGALIKANLPYVDTVRFGIKLPGTVNIIIEEDQVVYAIRDQDQAWWLMNSDGRIVEQTTGSKAASHTQIVGVTLESPEPNTVGKATENVSTETYPSEDANAGQLVPVVQTNAQRLTAVLQILQALEDNDIVGSAASVDVTRLEDIILWYGTRYQVNLGDNSNLEYKIACMNDVILQMSDYQSGILDISFSIWPDKVVYTPFS